MARKDAEEAGFESLRTAEEVKGALDQSGLIVVFVNSICGCAGGIARPAGKAWLQTTRDVKAYTVFAGQDKEATETARAYFTGYPPSSPSFAVLRDGEMIGMVERLEIEGASPEEVTKKLTQLTS
ncbi:BrxA/BrxB family bacilliredoxin [Bacillaceae bacterium SIJ1]|nr:BrxA/BrxB family bacilliredoxin [Litoribacterium kuwaitense]